MIEFASYFAKFQHKNKISYMNKNLIIIVATFNFYFDEIARTFKSEGGFFTYRNKKSSTVLAQLNNSKIFLQYH